MDLRARKQVRDQILACHNCKLASQPGIQPVAFTAPAHTRIMVIGEAPGKQENEQGRPFVGPAGKLLGRELTRLGLDVDSVAYANVVCCQPVRQPATPTNKEMAACRQNLVAQLELIQPEFVLLVGATAVASFWRSMGVKTIRGAWWQLSTTPTLTTWCFATIHPAAVLRDRHLRDGFVADLESFLLGYVSGPWRNWWCAKCNHYTSIRVGLEGVGEWGVSLCAKCLSGVGRPFAVPEHGEQGVLL